METKKLYFMDCHLAGRMYHDADEVWEGLKVGTLVRLERELDNRHDPNAVMVVYEKDGEQFKIGYIPRGENVIMSSSAASAELSQKLIRRIRCILPLRLSAMMHNYYYYGR